MNIMNYPIITIPGRPVSLKNGKRAYSGRVVWSKRVSQRLELDTWLVRSLWNRPPLKGPVSLDVKSYLANFRTDGNLFDTDNLFCYPADILQRARVLVDDRQIEHYDGSRRICLCDTCPDKAWMPRKNMWKKCGAVKKCPKEKTVIKIEVLR